MSVLLVVVFAVNIAITSAYAAAAGSVSRTLSTRTGLRWIGRVGGVAMMSTSALIVAR